MNSENDSISRSKPWYADYPRYRDEAIARRMQFDARCKELNISPSSTLEEFARDLIARAVHESNWTEGIELSLGKTRELNDIVFADFAQTNFPHLDIPKLLGQHKKTVLRLKRKRATYEQLAALNLSAAHYVLKCVGSELLHHYSAALVKLIKEVEPLIDKLVAEKKLERGPIDHGLAAARRIEAMDGPIAFPATHGVTSQTQLFAALLNLDAEVLLRTMEIHYVHLLHQVLFMGIFPLKKCGVFRKGPVNVGNPTLLFPPANAVSSMMDEFCKSFPPVCPGAPEYDPIFAAAKCSHRFVAIHPYSDGNGRISRLLMNLVLWAHHPPVFLKADKKGRGRYYYALRRADRGQIEPLASLIARSIIDTYDSMLRALSARTRAADSKANEQPSETRLES